MFFCQTQRNLKALSFLYTKMLKIDCCVAYIEIIDCCANVQARIWKIDCADKKYREQYLTTIKELVTEQIRTQQFIARHPYPVTKLEKATFGRRGVSIDWEGFFIDCEGFLYFSFTGRGLSLTLRFFLRFTLTGRFFCDGDPGRGVFIDRFFFLFYWLGGFFIFSLTGRFFLLFSLTGSLAGGFSLTGRGDHLQDEPGEGWLAALPTGPNRAPQAHTDGPCQGKLTGKGRMLVTYPEN